jgi:hypothetical protein
MPVEADRALYIKLGEGGCYERECINKGILRLGYHEWPHDLCLRLDRGEIAQFALAQNIVRSRRAASDHARQIAEFYSAGDDVLWITFHGDCMWWCRSPLQIERHDDGTKTRPTRNGWSNRDANGCLLDFSRLSGWILAKRMYRQTICEFPDSHRDELLAKINGIRPTRVLDAEAARRALLSKAIPLVQSLHEHDFEVLIDLICQRLGLVRVSGLGGVEKDVDIDMRIPLTGERFAIQIKSRAGHTEIEGCRTAFSGMAVHNRFAIASHTAKCPELLDLPDGRKVEFWGAERIAEQIVELGLLGWLFNKAS